MGQERSGTRSAPGSPSMDCSKPGAASVLSLHQSHKSTDMLQRLSPRLYIHHPKSVTLSPSPSDEALQPKTPCERLRESVLASSAGGRPLAGAYAPQCDEDGHYVPRQVSIC